MYSQAGFRLGTVRASSALRSLNGTSRAEGPGTGADCTASSRQASWPCADERPARPERVFSVLRTAPPWRDLPERYGPYTTASNRWAKAGQRATTNSPRDFSQPSQSQPQDCGAEL
ncbi:transposase [Paracoccus versutus]|nr:transposase [Paracoccus versutus]